MSVKAVVNEGGRYADPIGLKDGGHVYLTCSACAKRLVDIWITRPNLKDPATGEVFEWDFQAHCCYCGDHSYIEKIYGGFVIGGYALPHETDPEADYPQTVVDKQEEDEKGVIHVYTARARNS